MKKILNYIIVAIVFLLLGVLLSRNMFYQEQINIEDIVDKNISAIVSIDTYNENNSLGNGSGFIYKIDDKYAYILTNNHVIENSNEILITTHNNEKIKAKLLGSDIYSDIAILTIDKKYAKDSLILGSSNSLKLGQTILTISSPISSKYKNTVTRGIISGLDRQIKVSLSNGNFIIDSIQIDAAINAGSSGGAVLDLNGKVIGIIYSKLEEQNEGIGFIIPIDNVKEIINIIESGKHVQRPSIGIEACNTTDIEKLNENSITIDENVSGVVVLDAYNNSSLSNVGIKKGDVIYKIDDIEISDITELKYCLYKHKIGDKIKIYYYRDGKKFSVDMKL